MQMTPPPNLPGPATSVTVGYAGGGSASFPKEVIRKRPNRSGCALCAYYDPGRTYCLYVETPVTILFVCPWLLSLQR